jgi:ABC-2 type transport system ATP-binding protein
MSTVIIAGGAALAFKAVTKCFSTNRALDGFDLEVKRGELFALVGQNGAGKTTLLKCLLDFCEPDSGDIEIFGISSRMTAARRDVAFLPNASCPHITSLAATSFVIWPRSTVVLTLSSA